MGVQVTKSEFITLRDNDVRFGNHGRTGDVAHGAGIAVADGQDVLVEDNRICENRRCSGVVYSPASGAAERRLCGRPVSLCDLTEETTASQKLR